DGASRSRLATVLYTSAEALRIATQLLYPIMPDATAKIWRQLGQSSELSSLSLESVRSPLETGGKVGKVEPDFPRLEGESTVKRLHRLQQEPVAKGFPNKQVEPAAAAQPVSTEKLAIEDFLKLDLRVGEVRTAERVKGASKLLRLEVDIGTEIRQIVAGIAEA